MFASSRQAPRRFESGRSAFRKSAHFKNAPRRFARLKLAPQKVAWSASTPARFARVRSAPLRQAPFRRAFRRSAPASLASLRSASCRWRTRSVGCRSRQACNSAAPAFTTASISGSAIRGTQSSLSWLRTVAYLRPRHDGRHDSFPSPLLSSPVWQFSRLRQFSTIGHFRVSNNLTLSSRARARPETDSRTHRVQHGVHLIARLVARRERREST